MTAEVDVTLLAVGSCRERAFFVAGSAGRGVVTFPALVAVVRHPRAGVILFDTGYGEALRSSRSFLARLYRRVVPFALPPEQTLITQLSRLGVKPEDLAAVVISHFHPDHIGALRELPGVPVHAAACGLAALRRLRGFARWRQVFLPELLPDDLDARLRPFEDAPAVRLPDALRPFTSARDVLGDGSLLLIALPGHALGQHGLLCRLANGRTLLLAADAAWLRANFVDLALPFWPVRRFLGDELTWRESQAALHALQRNRPDLLIVPSHCAATQDALRAAGLVSGPGTGDDGPRPAALRSPLGVDPP